MPDLDKWQAIGATAPLTTPTPDGSGQAVHPDVLYAPRGFAGKRWWMVYEPYPAMSDPLENPCVVSSDDGLTWAVPAGATNPIEPQPGTPGGTDYNSDAELLLSLDGATMYCVFRQVISGTERIVYKSTTDGVNWTAKQTLFTTGALSACLSPSITHDGTQWVMFSVSGDTIPRVIQKRTAPALTGPWSAPTTGTITLPTTIGGGLAQDPWHLDVVYRDGYYVALVNSKTGTAGQAGGLGELVLAASVDGLTWKAATHSVVYPSGNAWDSAFYRSTLVSLPNGGYRIYYTGITSDSLTWRIGVTETQAAAYVTADRRWSFGRLKARFNSIVGIAQDERDIPALVLRRYSLSQTSNPFEYRDENDVLKTIIQPLNGGMKIGGYSALTGSNIRHSDDGIGVNGSSDFRNSVWIATSDTGTLLVGRNAEGAGGARVIGLGNAASVPNANPSAGAVVYAHNGAGRLRSMGGTITTWAGEVVSKSANYTAAVEDRFILATGGAGGITITLPAAVKGSRYVVKKVDAGAGAITIATTSAQTIDGVTAKSLAAQWDKIQVVSDGTAWFTV